VFFDFALESNPVALASGKVFLHDDTSFSAGALRKTGAE
jgi:hypothetical protein